MRFFPRSRFLFGAGFGLLPAVVVFDTPDWKADTDEAAIAGGFVVFDTGDYVIDDLAVTGLPLFVQGQNVYVEN